MIETSRYHSVKIDKRKCIGCVACMKACPTKAIRICEKKAKIFYEKCIDCGECIRCCPYDAVIPITTTTTALDNYKYRVALPSPVLYSQFGQHVMPSDILTILQAHYFDYVYDEALMCEMVSMAIERYLDDHKSPRPIISSICPVVVRLIQRLFPSLCKLVIPIEPPREIAAKNLRNEISSKNQIKEKDVGIFHITPCAAKVVSINYPVSLEKSHLDGAISIRDIFNPIMMELKKNKKHSLLQTQIPTSGIGVGWAMEGGEIRGLKHMHTVSVSGVYDTIKILEDVEAGKLKDIEYLECLICPDGCIGGPLTIENRFLAKSHILRLIKIFGGKKKVDGFSVKKLYDEGFFSFETELEPKPFPPLADSRKEALEKLKRKEQIADKLPGIDCGLCGSPDCQTFAEDIVRGDASLEDCIIMEHKENNE